MEYSRRGYAPAKSPFRAGTENASPKTSIADRYLESLNSPGSPLKPRSPARVNATMEPASSPTRSPSPSKHLFESARDIGLLKNSSSSHFRTLAADRSAGLSSDGSLLLPGITDNVEDVAGLQGRIKLQRQDDNSVASKNWMDKQRQNLQAYEYLCHVGEAKEWIESCIGEEIAPVVKLEDALRDGVVLAKLTRVFAPDLVRRIYESPRLQFRHSENINYFFSFLDRIGMPELFAFELTDLYDKKNIPKVIYSIHALSFILSGDNLAPSIGNLVGKLEFTDDELHRAQRGLDAAAGSLPNFGAMNNHFEPAPAVPQVSAEEQLAMDLDACTPDITTVQAACRGHLCRLARDADAYIMKRSSPQICTLQSCIRAGRVRRRLSSARQTHARQESTWTALQGACRGNLLRQKKDGLKNLLDSERDSIVAIQALIRAFPVRKDYLLVTSGFSAADPQITSLQSTIRAGRTRRAHQATLAALRAHEREIVALQSIARSAKRRQVVRLRMDDILDSELWVKRLQSIARGSAVRNDMSSLKSELAESDVHTQVLELQCAARGALVRCTFNEDKAMLNSAKVRDAITQLQSIWRGGEVRADIADTMDHLSIVEPSIIRLQSTFRGVMARFSHAMLMDEFEDELENIVDMQAIARGFLVRQQFSDRMNHFRSNLDKVIKIQSFVRAKKQGDAYKSLITGSNPPLSTVKNFVHLLADSDLDFEEEMTLEQSRKRVVDEVRTNEMLEQYVTQLDVKIALLLKNKITLDEVVRHRNKGLAGSSATTTPGAVNSAGDLFDLKALNKSSRRRLELYQGFFYILQTQPQYLARLFRSLRGNSVLSDKEAQGIENLVMTIYGQALKLREEFFLLQLIGRSIHEELEHCDSVKSFVRGNFIWWKLVATMNRGTKSRRSLREILSPVVARVVESHTLDLESDPLAIYRASINNEELQTGRLSSRTPNLDVTEAIQDPETRSIYIANLQNLRELCSEFLTTIEQNLENVSYHIRYIAREVCNGVDRRFFRNMSEEDKEEKLLAVVGHVLFANYLNPAIVASDKYGIVTSALGPQQSKNLIEVTKLLSQVASLRPFSRDNVYLQPLNDYIKTCVPRMRRLLKQAIYVPDPEQEYDTNIYDDLTAHQRPTLQIKTSDIFQVHSLVCQQMPVLVPSLQAVGDNHQDLEKDSLYSVVAQLGNLPNDASEILNIARFTEVKLDLNPSFCRVEDPEAEVNSLFVATKRCMLYVLRVQTGATLLDILLGPVMAEHEQKFRAILKEEAIERGKRNVAYTENILGDLSKLTYRELKLLALEKVIELESTGRVTREDNYQGILNSIALDIRTKRNRRVARQKEMEGIKQTLAHLSEKEAFLQTQVKTYNNYIEQAMSTLQTKKGRRKPLKLPFTKQYFHMRELEKAGRMPKFGSYKYTASSLFEKGVLVELNGYSEKQYNQVTFTFSSDEVGVFNIEAAYGSIVLPGATTALTLDDLLGQQYNNKQYIPLFDDMVRFNTNLTLHFIFRKFYGDSQ